MKRLLFTTVLALMAFVDMSAQNDPIGGAGWMYIPTGADPNTMTGIANPPDLVRGDAAKAYDYTNKVTWEWNATTAQWEILMTGANYVDGNTIDFTPTSAEIIKDPSTENIITDSPTGILVDAPVDGVSATDSPNGADISIDGNQELDVSIDVNELTAETTVDAAADFVPMFDASAGANVKVAPSNLTLSQWREFTSDAKTDDNTSGTYHTGLVAIGTNGGGGRLTVNTSTERPLELYTTGAQINTLLQDALGTGDVTHTFKKPAQNWNIGMVGNDNFGFVDVTDGTVPLSITLATGGIVADKYKGTGAAAFTGNHTYQAAFDETTGQVIQVQYKDRLVAYKNHAAAQAGGVLLDEEFKASSDNTMGESPGTVLARL